MTITPFLGGSGFSDGVRVGAAAASTFNGGLAGALTSPTFVYQVQPQKPVADYISPSNDVAATIPLPLNLKSPIQIWAGGFTVVVLDCPRTVTFTPVAQTNKDATFTINGYDYQKNPMTETVFLASGAKQSQAYSGNKAFTYIKSIIASADPKQKISVGTGSTLGLPYAVTNPAYVNAYYAMDTHSWYEGFSKANGKNEVEITTPLAADATTSVNITPINPVPGETLTPTLAAGKFTVKSNIEGSTTAFYWRLSFTGTTNASDFLSLSTLSQTSGTAKLADGTVQVNTPFVAANSQILLSVNTKNGTQGALYVSAIDAGKTFDIKSTADGDTSTVNWAILNPYLGATPAVSAGTVITADQTNPSLATSGDVRGTFTPAIPIDGTSLLTAYFYLSGCDQNYIDEANQVITGLSGVPQYYNPSYLP